MNRFAQLRRSQEGFTLIELLVVVAIIALLATFAVPKLFEAIGKSKKAPGQADMQTISSAMERLYMDKSNYPKIGTKTSVAADLKNGYLKAQISFLNGFKVGYFYLSDADGTYYVMVDPGNNSTDITLTCGSRTATLTPDTTGLKVGSLSGSGTPTSAELAACALTGTSFNADGTSIVTN